MQIIHISIKVSVGNHRISGVCFRLPLRLHLLSGNVWARHPRRSGTPLLKKEYSMAGNVTIECPPHTDHPSTEFNVGDEIRVVYHGTFLEAGVPVQFQIYATNPSNAFSPLLGAATIGFDGTCYYDFTLPNVNAQATVWVHDQDILEGGTVTKNIGIGVVANPTLPTSFWDTVFKIAEYTAVGVGASIVAYFGLKALGAYRETKKPE